MKGSLLRILRTLSGPVWSLARVCLLLPPRYEAIVSYKVYELRGDFRWLVASGQFSTAGYSSEAELNNLCYQAEAFERMAESRSTWRSGCPRVVELASCVARELTWGEYFSTAAVCRITHYYL